MISKQTPDSPVTLKGERALATFLLETSVRMRKDIRADEVAIYLVEPATRRLRIRAWATDTRSGHRTDPDTPHDLTDHGIDGADLTIETLRGFIHSAPGGHRLVKPLHDGDSWVGAVVCVSSEGFGHAPATEFVAAAQNLSEVLSHAGTRLTSLQVREPESSIDLPSEPIFGHAASAGVALGPALLFDSDTTRGQTGVKVEESREEALIRLDRAVEKTRADLEKLTKDTGNELYDVVSLLFSTHVMMLTDEAFSGVIRQLVVDGQTPEDAVQSIVASFVKTFGNIREARLAEKAQDVRDIGFRLLQNLSKGPDNAQDYTGKIVILGDVLPSDLVRLALGHASGVVILGATVTAHISILAQSLGLPTVITSDRTAMEIVDDAPLLLDGESGKLFVSPSAEQIASYGLNEETFEECCLFDEEDDLEPGPDARHVMADNQPVTILANVNLLSDARRGHANGAEGIGLYRSEFPFIIRNDFITEEEQYRIYRSVVQSMPGKPVTLRTADIGGDKLMAGREEERNPFLGVRGIRFSLANRDLFRRQLRAMLRAGAGADLGIMFPMVASHDEIEDAREEMDACREALRREGREFNDSPRIGAMVELPSAVIGIEELASRTDFLSIGTNDLIMYLLAVDRTNERLSELYRSHHPVVLRTLAELARRIDPIEDDLSVCGESASDPLMIPFFLGIGIRKLSVAPRQIKATAATAGSFDKAGAVQMSEELLGIRSVREMDSYVKAFRGAR